MPGAADRRAWERVLAAVDADAARASALLTGHDDPPPEDDHRGRTGQAEPDPDGSRPPEPAADGPDTHRQPRAAGPGGIPADWRLPAGPGQALPDIADMPPIPTELRNRIHDLRDRIDALQADLARALQLARTLRVERIPVPGSPPGYIDRKL